MSGRKLNSLERNLHQAVLARTDKVSVAHLSTRVYESDTPPACYYPKIISQNEVEDLVSNPTDRLAAINFLLGTVRVR